MNFVKANSQMTYRIISKDANALLSKNELSKESDNFKKNDIHSDSTKSSVYKNEDQNDNFTKINYNPNNNKSDI